MELHCIDPKFGAFKEECLFMTEFSKSEVVRRLADKGVHGNISYDNLLEVVFDPRFPQSYFSKARMIIETAKQEDMRFEQLSYDLQERYSSIPLLKSLFNILGDSVSDRRIKAEIEDQLKETHDEISKIKAELKLIGLRIETRKLI